MRTFLASLLLTAAALGQDDLEQENRALRERLEAAEQRLSKAEETIARLEQERPAEGGLEEAVDAYLRERETAAPRGEDLAGYDDGFFVRSRDGRFLLRLNGMLQARFATNHQEDSLGDPHRTGFEIPRAKLLLTGHAFGGQWTYRIESNFDVDGGEMILEDAWVSYWHDRWQFAAGQFKCPVLREEKVDGRYQLAAERSVVNDTLTSGERLSGIAVGYYADRWRAWGAFSDGDGPPNPNAPALAAETEYALTFRGELLVKGDSFTIFDDFTSFPDDEPGMMLAVAAHFQRGESGSPASETEVMLLSADFSAEFGGSNFFVQGIYVQVEEGNITRDLMGIVVQGGYFATDKVEAFARWEFADLDAISPVGDVNILTLGANWYIDRHRIKLTGDAGYAFDAVPVTTRYSNWRAEQPFTDGQFLLRLQIQLLF